MLNNGFHLLIGVVPGGDEVSLQVTFKPIDFSTAILKLQVLTLKITGFYLTVENQYVNITIQ